MSSVLMSEQGIERLIGRLHAVSDPRQQRQLLQTLVAPKKTTVLSFFNQHAFNVAWSDAGFRDSLERSDVLLRDGVGISLLLKLLGRDPGLNMNGTDLIPQIVRAYKGRRVAVVGTASPYLEQASQQLREMGAKVVFTQDGFADEARYLGKLVAAEPELVILGMGMPRQEHLAAKLSPLLRRPALIVNGGAILDFLAGRFPRAPQWLRSLRLEWLYRLLREPRRLWRRYVVGGATFALRALRMGWRSEASAQRALGMDIELAEGVATAVFDADHPSIVQLLQRVEAALPAQDRRIVQFVAVRPGDGASTIAQGYAQACAQWRGRRVLLVSELPEADAPWLGDPAWRQALRVSPPTQGVTVARPNGGGGTAQAAGLADRSLWQALEGLFDEIVVDVGGPLALLAAPSAGGIVLVAQAESTPASAAQRRLEELAASNANVLGVVLNRQQSYLPRVLLERF